VIDNK